MVGIGPVLKAQPVLRGQHPPLRLLRFGTQRVERPIPPAFKNVVPVYETYVGDGQVIDRLTHAKQDVVVAHRHDVAYRGNDVRQTDRFDVYSPKQWLGHTTLLDNDWD